MAWAHVQSRGIQSSGSVASLARAFASNVTAGNHIAVGSAIYRASGTPPEISTVTDGLSNTYASVIKVESVVDNHAQVDIYHAMNIAGGACTVTVTPNSNSFMSMAITESSGLKTTLAAGETKTNLQNSATPSTGTFAVTDAGVVFGVLSHTGSDTTFAVGAGYTLAHEEEDTTEQPISMEYKAATGGGTNENAAWTLGAARDCLMVAAAFDEVAGGAAARRTMPLIDGGVMGSLIVGGLVG